MHDTNASTPQAPADGPGVVATAPGAGLPGAVGGPVPEAGEPEAAPAGSGGVAPVAAAPSLVGRLLGVLKREPVLFVSLSYILVSFMGIWSTYWFYRTLGLPILDYLQGSDLFIAGLRRPEYVLLLAGMLLLLWVAGLPWRWAEQHPQQVAELRRRRWWGRLVFPEQSGWAGLWGMRSDTLLVLTFLFVALHYLHAINTGQAGRMIAGKPSGQQVRLTLAGAADPLPGAASLLGTTSMFVMVWWPDARRVEALPTANIARIESAFPDPARAAAGRARAPPPASGTPSTPGTTPVVPGSTGTTQSLVPDAAGQAAPR